MKISQNRIDIALKHVANYFGVEKWSYIQSENDNIIETYFSILVPVTFIGVDDKEEIRIPIFMKFAPTDIVEESKGILKQHFEVEEYAYRCLFTDYEILSHLDIYSFMPPCYYADLKLNNEVIVTKDMRSKGFKRYDKEEFLDKNHIRLSLEALAKFHSLSIMYKEVGGDFDNEILEPYSEKYDYIYHLQTKRTLRNRIDFFADTDYEEYLKNLEPNFDDFTLSTTTDVKFMVYGHGDFAKDNVLFKYKDSEPMLACLIDFQKVRRMSPALDILFFMLTCVEVTDIHQHNEYLSIYLDKFQSILNENGIDCPYSIDDLNHDMKVVAPYCISIAVMSYTLWFGLELDNFFTSKNISENHEKDTNKLKNTINSRIKQLNSYGYVKL